MLATSNSLQISELAGQTAARLARGDSIEFSYGWDDSDSEPATEGAAAVAAAPDAASTTVPELDKKTGLVEPLTELTLQEEPEESVPLSPSLVREPSAKTAMLSVAGPVASVISSKILLRGQCELRKRLCVYI